MQVTQADKDSCKRVGVEEHLINFRPSPNFKNMKKFIKSTYLGGSHVPDALGGPGPSSSTKIDRNTESHLQNVVGDWQDSTVQPPLPLDPPPSDLPTVKVKKEIEDPDYEKATTSTMNIQATTSTMNIQATTSTMNIQETQDPDQQKDHSNEICRDFIRGTCKRDGTCKFAHKHDLSQLEGVYTFCRKFQNSVCNFIRCKYVHASVFEEQHFYRTGYLPPHTFAHQLNNALQPPPPPPPPPEDPPVVMPFMDFSNPPPPIRPNEPEKPMISVIPTASTSGALEAGGYLRDVPPPAPPKTSPYQREWCHVDPFAVPPGAPYPAPGGEPAPRRCNNCDNTDFRLQHIKNKLDKTRQAKEQAVKKIARVDKQSDELRKLIAELLRPTISARSNQTSANAAAGDNDKKLIDLLANYLAGNKRHGEDK